MLFKKLFVDQLMGDIDLLLANERMTGAIQLMLCTMDIMAYLDMPAGQAVNYGKDFISWIEKYFMNDAYKEILPKEFYGLRCGLLHSYTLESTVSMETNRHLGFYWGRFRGPVFKHTDHPELLTLSVQIFRDSLLAAIVSFIETFKDDHDQVKRQLVHDRMKKMVQTLTIER